MAWLGDWSRRIKITIDKDQIDANIDNFPVPIYLSASSGQDNDDVSAIFDELSTVSGTKKIAITTSDGETQCYVEIERWGWSNEKAWLHTQIPTIVSGTDTDLYIYYDSTHADNDTYVGDVGSTPAQAVWDSSFKAVYHLGEDPTSYGDVNTTYLDEDMAVITDWADDDTGNAVSSQTTFDGKSCMSLAANTATTPNYAARNRNVGAFGNRVVVELSVYHETIGTHNAIDRFQLLVYQGGAILDVTFCSDGMFVHDGGGWNEVGTNIVVQDTWQKWTFDCDFSTPASANFDLYLSDVLVEENVDCSYTITGSDGLVRLLQYGQTTNNMLSYVDYIKIGDGFENIKDSTSNVNHGSPGGLMTSGNLVDGQFGKCLDFDGSDDYIDCGSDSSLDDITTKTIEAVVYLDTFGEATYGRIVQKSNVDADGWGVTLSGGTDNRLQLIQDWNGGSLAQWVTPTDSLSTTTWYGVAATYDNTAISNEPLLYIDGISQTVNQTGIVPAGTCDSDVANDMWIGARSNSGTDREFDGKIDEVRISSVIRTAAWINATYEGLWDNLLTYSNVFYPPGITCSGIVQVDSVFTDGIDVRLYRRSTGEFVGETTTVSGGLFEINSGFEEDHYIIALYTASGTNALIYDYIHP